MPCERRYFITRCCRSASRIFLLLYLNLPEFIREGTRSEVAYHGIWVENNLISFNAVHVHRRPFLITRGHPDDRLLTRLAFLIERGGHFKYPFSISLRSFFLVTTSRMS